MGTPGQLVRAAGLVLVAATSIGGSRAAAGPAPSRPATPDPETARTRKAHVAVLRGAPALPLIDPGKGIWVMDPTRTTPVHVCGPGLVDEAIRVEEVIRQLGTFLWCRGLECRGSVAEDATRLYRLRFASEGPDLRLHALLVYETRWGRRRLPDPTLPARTCPGPTAVTPVVPPVRTATPRRLAPVGDLNPTEASPDLVRRLATGTWPLSRFVEPRVGLLHTRLTPVIELGHRPFSRQACGRAVQGALTRLQGDLGRALRMRTPIRCRTLDGGAECVFGREGERSYHRYLSFRSDPRRGLILDAYVESDDGITDLDRLVEVHTARRQLLRRHHERPAPCPAP